MMSHRGVPVSLVFKAYMQFMGTVCGQSDIEALKKLTVAITCHGEQICHAASQEEDNPSCEASAPVQRQKTWSRRQSPRQCVLLVDAAPLCHRPTWVYVAMAMQHLLCCRITEILRTKKEDIDIAGRRCFIKPMKGGGGLWKPLSEAAVLLLSRWETNDGLKVQRSRKFGNRGIQTFTDGWNWPIEEGDFMFPSQRRDAKIKTRTKDCCISKHLSCPACCGAQTCHMLVIM